MQVQSMYKLIENCFREYGKKIKSVRFLSAVALMVALICAIATGIDRLILDKQEQITPWMAPHFFDNVFFVTFYGFIICYMYSDVPFMNRSELYRILREGRVLWCIEKMISIVMQAFTMTALTMVASILIFIPMVQFEWDWGKIIYTMAFSNNLYDYDIFGNVSPVILSKYTPIQAMLLCFLVVWLVSSLIGLLMFGISLYSNRVFAVAVAVGLTGMNLSEMKFWTATWLPYVTPFYWCRMSIYGGQIFGNRYYPSLKFYLILTGIGILLLIVGIMLRAKHIEYIWNKEE